MKDYFVNLFEYENWANKEIADCLINLEEVPERALSLMSHIINAQAVWLGRIKNTDYDTASVWKTLDKSAIPEELNKSSLQLTKFLNNISENDLKEIIDYTNTKGEKFRSSLTEILTHLALHSAYHRGQVILLIKPLVHELPYVDYIHFTRKILNAH